jgi:hypothetical protein
MKAALIAALCLALAGGQPPGRCTEAILEAIRA